MIEKQHLLFELGCEELPPKALLKLSNALLANIEQGLIEAELSFTLAKAYATPRRLAVFIENLDASQADKDVKKRGPALQAAFESDGVPSKAALAFAQSCDVPFDALERLVTDKGEWLAYTQKVAGKTVQQLIPDIISNSIDHLPIPKRMRWGSADTEFVRPVHWAVLMYGDQVIDTKILGLQTAAITFGHRFHAPKAIVLKSPCDYLDTLFTTGNVIADFLTRQDRIRKAAEKAAAEVGGIAHIEDELLEEVTALNEFPVPITGRFDARFLALPAEVLMTTMQSNQKYFPVKKVNGELLSYFITFSNIESKHPTSIQQGNERVVTPRLSDAEFFWKQDRRKPLADYSDRLTTIVFQEKLGTMAQKAERLVHLAAYIAPLVQADSDLAKRAAFLAKNDLMTDMVGEFGNLQGIIGRYYAQADGEPAVVALAIEEHYLPKQSGGALPTCDTGRVVALAEKIDTLTGIFSAGLIPTGDKDPYALRRAALGLLRIIIENKISLNIQALIRFSLSLFTHAFNQTETEAMVVDFIFDRLKSYAFDKNFKSDEFEAVLAVHPLSLYDFMQRLDAVKLFRQKPEGEALAAANKRIGNLLKKNDATSSLPQTIRLVEPVETDLLALAQQASQDIQPLLSRADYQATLERLAALKEPIDAFFENVMVMTDDLDLRQNRLALLDLLSTQFLTCADISKLQA